MTAENKDLCETNALCNIVNDFQMCVQMSDVDCILNDNNITITFEIMFAIIWYCHWNRKCLWLKWCDDSMKTDRNIFESFSASKAYQTKLQIMAMIRMNKLIKWKFFICYNKEPKKWFFDNAGNGCKVTQSDGHIHISFACNMFQMDVW